MRKKNKNKQLDILNIEIPQIDFDIDTSALDFDIDKSCMAELDRMFEEAQKCLDELFPLMEESE